MARSAYLKGSVKKNSFGAARPFLQPCYTLKVQRVYRRARERTVHPYLEPKVRSCAWPGQIFASATVAAPEPMCKF